MQKKEPVHCFGKHEAVSLDLPGSSHLECGHTLLLPISDSKTEVV